MLPDLHKTLDKLHSGQIQPIAEMDQSIAVAQSGRCHHVFLGTCFDQARAVAATPDIAKKPLAGLSVSVKDLFDIGGQTTSAGSLVLRDAPPAISDSTAVARLRLAGAAFIGRTNMSEFAFSGVGINPHYGTPHNPAAKDVPRIPGGSSSGAAVSVATGAAYIGLGSDTGGSIRIPAALCGVVGFKSTARLVPADGTLPLSTTLDTVCALTRCVPDAMMVHEILAQRRIVRSPAPLSAYRLGIARTLMLDDLDTTVARAWHRTLDILRRAGARIEDIALPEINELQQMQANGSFSAAESYVWHYQLLASKKDSYDDRVAARIERGSSMSARDYIELLLARRDWIDRMTHRLQGFDAVLSPTVAVVAPPISDVAPGAQRDDAFFRTNSLLLRNTSVVNMLDGCAISIPCHVGGELPVGLMVWAGALQDDPVLNIAFEIEKLLQQPRL